MFDDWTYSNYYCGKEKRKRKHSSMCPTIYREYENLWKDGDGKRMNLKNTLTIGTGRDHHLELLRPWSEGQRASQHVRVFIRAPPFSTWSRVASSLCWFCLHNDSHVCLFFAIPQAPQLYHLLSWLHDRFLLCSSLPILLVSPSLLRTTLPS